MEDTCEGGSNIISNEGVGLTTPGLDNRFKECRLKCNDIEECRFFLVKMEITSCILYKSCDAIRKADNGMITFAKLVKGTHHFLFSERLRLMCF